MPRESQRIFGLDFLRATAVLFVIFHHSLGYVTPPHWVYLIGPLGSLGVEFLLVLTGYLAGRSLLQKLRREHFTSDLITTYYSRRWARTLPPYYFFMVIMAALSPASFMILWYHKEFIFFLQNLAWNIPTFYGQTWTLSVQEFFYLLCPLVLLICYRILKHRQVAFLCSILILFLVPLFLRALHTQVENSTNFTLIFREWTIFRFDSPAAGLLLAYVEQEAPEVWAWLQRNLWFSLTGLGSVILYYELGSPFLYSSHYLQVIAFPILSLCLALVFPSLCAWRQNQSPFGKMVQSISNMSYTLFLSHFIAFYLGASLLLFYPLNSLWLDCAVYAIFVWAVAYPSYLLVEAPLLKLRHDYSPQSRQSFFLTLFRNLTFPWGEGLDTPRRANVAVKQTPPTQALPIYYPEFSRR